MSTEGFKFQASIKDSDGDMVNIRADEAGEFEAALLSFPAAAYAQAKANVRGGATLGGITQPQAPPAQPQQYQQQAPPQQYTPPTPAAAAPPQQQYQQPAPQQPHGNAQLHPEGKQCEMCGQVLEFKKTQGGKAKWQCGQWRWNNGNPNGHAMEWIG